jgi:hypothetical protein
MFLIGIRNGLTVDRHAENLIQSTLNFKYWKVKRNSRVVSIFNKNCYSTKGITVNI